MTPATVTITYLRTPRQGSIPAGSVGVQPIELGRHTIRWYDGKLVLRGRGFRVYELASGNRVGIHAEKR